MTRFLKSAACIVALSSALLLASCSNEEAEREEQNASVVGIEKGAAPAVWTSDAEGTPVDPATQGKVETVAEVQMDDLQEERQEEVAQEPQESSPEIKQEAPAAKPAEKSSADTPADQETD